MGQSGNELTYGSIFSNVPLMTIRQQPLVSIVLTTLNGAVHIRESIDSCLSQTYQNLELIIVDGGSSDGTLAIVQSYADARIRVIHQQNNIGRLPGALNLGLDAARGEYLTWMQDDSVYEPHAIETMVHCLEDDTEIGQVCADYWQTDAEGHKVKRIEVPEPEDHLRCKSDPGGVCHMIRRSVREAVGPHDVSTYPTQDADYRWRIAMQFRSRRIAEPLYSWRLHPNSLSGRIPWLDLALNDIKVRLKLRLVTPAQARLDAAEFYMAYAFERYAAGQRHEVPTFVWSALLRDPRYILNRGVWSIALQSIAAMFGHKRYARANT